MPLSDIAGGGLTYGCSLGSCCIRQLVVFSCQGITQCHVEGNKTCCVTAGGICLIIFCIAYGIIRAKGQGLPIKQTAKVNICKGGICIPVIGLWFYSCSGYADLFFRNICGSACRLALKKIVSFVIPLKSKAGKCNCLVLACIFIIICCRTRDDCKVIATYLAIYGSITGNHRTVVTIIDFAVFYRHSGYRNFPGCNIRYCRRSGSCGIISGIVPLKGNVRRNSLICAHILIFKCSIAYLYGDLVVPNHTG